jgi:hypothetical protein
MLITPHPVRSDADALDILYRAMLLPPEPEVLTFILDERHVGGIVLSCTGVTHHDDVLGVMSMVLRASVYHPNPASLVVASVRPDDGFLPGDIARWVDLDQQCEVEGLQLIEWYVLGINGVELPRLHYGEPSRWP